MADDPQMQSGGATPGGWAPLPPVGGPSLEEEERAMKRGRGPMLAGMVGGVLLVIVGAVVALSGSGENPYVGLGQQVNGMRTAHFDMFWSCAIPREDVRSLDGAEAVRGAITRLASASPRAYARILRNDCLHHLEEHAQALNAVIPPEGAREGVDALRAALTGLTTAVRALLDHLDQVEGSFNPEDDDQGRAALTAVTRGWFDYRVAIGQVNDAVREHADD